MVKVLRKRWVFRLIGLGIFVLILLKIDLSQAWRTLATVDPLFVIFSLVLQTIGLATATLRWQLIMRHLEINIPFSRSFIHQLIGTAAALVTPGQLGEFIKVLYHRQEGFPLPESLLSVLIDRVYDLLMLLLFGFLAMAVLFGIPPTWTITLTAAGTIVLTVGFLVARAKQGSVQWFASILVSLSPRVYKETMQGNIHHLTQRIGEFKLSFLIECGLLTAANYLFLLFRIYALVLALHLNVPFWYFVMVVPLLRLVGLIPISVSGIGTRDITAIYLLGQVGVPEEAALIMSMLGLMTLQIQAFVGLLGWWRCPLQLGQKHWSSLGQLPPPEKEVSSPS